MDVDSMCNNNNNDPFEKCVFYNFANKLAPVCKTHHITPNMITSLRLLLFLILYMAITRGQIVLSFVTISIIMFTDCLDGCIARVNKQQSAFGKYFDFSVDICGVTMYLFLVYKLGGEYLTNNQRVLFMLLFLGVYTVMIRSDYLRSFMIYFTVMGLTVFHVK